jgi:hypothetical protein
MTRANIGVLVGAFVVGACHDYYYRPQNTSAAVASYAVPAHAPRGQVRLSSSGIVPLPTAAAERPRALHMVMTVENDGTQPWRVDTRQVMLTSDDGESAPLMATSGALSGLPTVEIPVGGTRAIDLYYGVPRAKNVSVRWQVDTARGTYKGETAFQRRVPGPTMPCGAVASQYCLSGYSS